MLRPELSSLRSIGASLGSDRIAAPQGGGAGDFSTLMRQVRSEVNDFIEHGSSGLGLNPAGQVLRLREQTAVDAAARASDDGKADTEHRAFLSAIAPWAKEAAQRLGVAPEIVAAQAALESGWGQRPLRDGDGRDTHNVFGIKAGASWQGRVAEAQTTEVEEGVSVLRAAQFRSYPDHASAFRDFTRLLLDNPRYQGALNAGADASAYAQGLVRGGYATDPSYADKLVRIAARLQRGD